MKSKGLGAALLVMLLVVMISLPALAGETIVFYAFAGGPRQQAIEEFVLPRFKELHPNIEVQVIYGTTAPDKLKTLIAGGADLDVIYTRLEDFPEFVMKGVYEPLEGYIKEGNYDLANIPKIALESFSYQGQLYGLPFDSLPFNVTTLFVNKDLFAASGMAIPQADPMNPSSGWTYQDARAIAKKLTIDTNGDKKPDVWGFSPGYGWIGNSTRLIWNHGGRLLEETDDGWKSGLSSPDVAEALQYARDLRFSDGVVGGNFMKGTLAVTHGAMGFMGNIYKKDVLFDWTLVSVPRGKDGRWNIAHSNPMGIYTGSKHKEAAFEFIKFWLSDEAQFYMNELGALPPQTWSAARRPEYIFTDTPPYDKTPFFLGRSRALPVWAPQWVDIQNLCNDTFNKAYKTNDVSVGNLLVELDRQVRGLLQLNK